MLFSEAMICDYSMQKRASIRVESGQIVEIGNLSPLPDESVLDCKDLLLMPSIIDLNVAPKAKILSTKHLHTLSIKAHKGGVGTILLNPFTTPSCNESSHIELVKSIDKEIPLHLLPSINPMLDSTHLSNISMLRQNGAYAISTKSDICQNLLFRIAQYAQMLDIPLCCFAQDCTLADGVINEGLLSTKLGLPSIPAFSQTKEVAKICEMLSHLPIEIIFESSIYPRSIELINYYKSLDSQATFYSQVSLHHLILDESACEDYNTSAKLNPPLLDLDSKNKLIEQVRDGQVDLLSIMQCADFNSNKDQVFELSSFGIDAISDYFSLFFTYLSKDISLSTFSKLTSHNPAKILNLNYGSLEVGKQAEFILIDLNKSYLVNDSFSPYFNQKLNGLVTHIFSNDTLYPIKR